VKGQKTSNPGQNPGHRGIQDRTQKKGLSWEIQDGWSPYYYAYFFVFFI